MNDETIARLYAEADRESNGGETAMLVSPLIVMSLIDQLRRCEGKRQAAGAYDELHDA